MNSFFINHTKAVIAVTDKNASKNISMFLCNAIKENAWSITDNIEYVDYLKVSSNQNWTMANLVENQYYHCDPLIQQTFYNY